MDYKLLIYMASPAGLERATHSSLSDACRACRRCRTMGISSSMYHRAMRRLTTSRGDMSRRRSLHSGTCRARPSSHRIFPNATGKPMRSIGSIRICCAALRAAVFEDASVQCERAAGLCSIAHGQAGGTKEIRRTPPAAALPSVIGRSDSVFNAAFWPRRAAARNASAAVASRARNKV